MAADAASFAQGSSYIDLLPVGPGPTRRLERKRVRYFNARWLPDGKRVVVRAGAQQQARLYELSLDDGAMRAFTPEGVGFFWSVSPDGTRAAFTAGQVSKYIP